MPARRPGDPLPKALVRQIRHHHGLSQDELARRLGLRGGKSVISGWENGHAKCEGPAAELLLLLFGEDQSPPRLAALLNEAERRWKRAGNFVDSWRQVWAFPTTSIKIPPASYAALFPEVAIPSDKIPHGFPFVDLGLPERIYGLSEGRWTGVIPIEHERAPHSLWMLGHDGAFIYREHLWEESPRAVTEGHTHVGSLLQLALAAIFFIRRLAERTSLPDTLSYTFGLELQGMAGRGITAYRLERPAPDVTLDRPTQLARDAHLRGSVSKTTRELQASPLEAGFALVAEIAASLRPDLTSPQALREQLRRRHFEDARNGTGHRFLAFLDGYLPPPRRGIVRLRGHRAGVLEEVTTGFRFTYDAEYVKKLDALPLSPTMPLGNLTYESAGLHPFFANLLPEGFRLEAATRGRIDKSDRFGLLLAVGREMIGAVEVHDEREGPR